MNSFIRKILASLAQAIGIEADERPITERQQDVTRDEDTDGDRRT